MGKNFVYNFALSILNAAFSILTFKYATKILGPTGIGHAQFAISLAENFALVAAVGIPIYGITTIASKHTEDRGKAFAELASLSFLASMITGLVYLIIIFAVPKLHQSLSIHLIAGLLVFGSFTTIDWLYYGLEKFRTIVLRSILVKIIAVAFLLLSVKNVNDFENYLWFCVIGVLGNNILSWTLLRHQLRFPFKGLNVHQHLKPSLYILGSSLAINIYTLWDAVILGFLTNSKTVGIYYAAIKMVKFVVPFIISLGTVFIPKMSKRTAEDFKVDQGLALSFDFTCLITVPITVGIFILSPEIILLLSGEQFLAAVPIMRILSILPIIIGLGNIFALQILIPAKLNGKLFKAAWVAASSSVALNLTLIPIFGGMGAGISNVIAETLSSALLGCFVYKSLEIRFAWTLYLKAFALCFLFIPIVYGIKYFNLSPFLLIAFSAIGCGVVYFSSQWFIFSNASIAYGLKKLKIK